MNVDDLRPWEFWAMDAHELYLITQVKAAWESGKSDGREQSRQQADVAADLKQQRAAMKGKRRR